MTWFAPDDDVEFASDEAFVAVRAVAVDRREDDPDAVGQADDARLVVGGGQAAMERRFQGDGPGNGVDVGGVVPVDVDPEQRLIVDLPGLDRADVDVPVVAARVVQPRADRHLSKARMPAATIAKRASPTSTTRIARSSGSSSVAVAGWTRIIGRSVAIWTLCGSSRARAGGRRRAGVWCGVDEAEHRAAPLPSARERAVGIYHARFTRGLRRAGALRHPCKESAPDVRRLRGRVVGTVFAWSPGHYPRRRHRAGHASEVPS